MILIILSLNLLLSGLPLAGILLFGVAVCVILILALQYLLQRTRGPDEAWFHLRRGESIAFLSVLIICTILGILTAHSWNTIFLFSPILWVWAIVTSYILLTRIREQKGPLKPPAGYSPTLQTICLLPFLADLAAFLIFTTASNHRYHGLLGDILADRRREAFEQETRERRPPPRVIDQRSCDVIPVNECTLSRCEVVTDCNGVPICQSKLFMLIGGKKCVPVGGTAQTAECCEGLKRLCIHSPAFGACNDRYPGSPLPTKAALCLPCGNGQCDIGENFCNCPEDCPDWAQTPEEMRADILKRNKQKLREAGFDVDSVPAQ